MIEQIAERMREIKPFYVMELLQRAKILEEQGRDIVHMEIGEPDFATPAAVINAGTDSLRDGMLKYTPSAGLPELRAKIAAYYQRTYGVYVDEQRIFITPGASGAFLLALGVTVNPGDRVILADPGYPCNSNFVRLFGGKPQFVAVDAQTDFQLNARLIERHWSKTTQAVLITSPSNPTGTIITANDLHQSIELVARLGGCFFSDEIYHGLVYQRQAETALRFSNQVFVINSFSKFFGMTGWRIGWLVVPDAYCDAITKLAQNLFISTSSLAQHAALAAFDERNLDELESRRQEFARRGEFLYRQLQQIGFEIAVRPEGAFYIYADCSRFSDNSFDFARDLLEQAGVAVTPGMDFGQNKPERFVRFAYTTSLQRLEEGVDRIGRFVRSNR